MILMSASKGDASGNGVELSVVMMIGYLFIEL